MQNGLMTINLNSMAGIMPTWKRQTAKTSSLNASTILPLPSSPHWSPKIRVLDAIILPIYLDISLVFKYFKKSELASINITSPLSSKVSTYAFILLVNS